MSLFLPSYITENYKTIPRKLIQLAKDGVSEMDDDGGGGLFVALGDDDGSYEDICNTVST